MFYLQEKKPINQKFKEKNYIKKHLIFHQTRIFLLAAAQKYNKLL